MAGGGTVKLGVFALDHCAPHVTCRESNRRWVIRIDFSFIHDAVTLRDVTPPQNRPAAHVIAALEVAVLKNLPAYRDKWWGYQKMVGLSEAESDECRQGRLLPQQQHAARHNGDVGDL